MAWLTKKKTMMVGIDVTHPGPGSREGTPSIAAVVASVDDSFVQFPASLRVQRTKKEVPIIIPDMKWTRTNFFLPRQMLDELQDMMVERLLVYEKKNKELPARVIVYRDGVSEVSLYHSFYDSENCSDHQIRDNLMRSWRKSFLRF